MRQIVVKNEVDYIRITMVEKKGGYSMRTGMTQIVKWGIPDEFYQSPLHAIFCAVFYGYRHELNRATHDGEL